MLVHDTSAAMAQDCDVIFQYELDAGKDETSAWIPPHTGSLRMELRHEESISPVEFVWEGRVAAGFLSFAKTVRDLAVRGLNEETSSSALDGLLHVRLSEGTVMLSPEVGGAGFGVDLGLFLRALCHASETFAEEIRADCGAACRLFHGRMEAFHNDVAEVLLTS